MSASRAALLAGMLAALASFSCGSDRDDGAARLVCIQFRPAAAPAPGTVAAIDGAGSVCGVADLELVITDVPDVFAAAFTVTFDPALVSFSAVSTTGSVLESDGAALEVVVVEGTGAVDVFVSRFGVSTGVNAVCAATLLTVRFVPIAPAGSTMVTFSATKVLGSETPPLEKPGITWSGGVLELL